jgi:hypothetical protein
MEIAKAARTTRRMSPPSSDGPARIEMGHAASAGNKNAIQSVRLQVSGQKCVGNQLFTAST